MPAAAVVTERKLPVRQLIILAICRFAEPIATTSLFPYLPEMVGSLGVPEDDVGTWTGICSGIFSVSQAIMGIPWGRFSDQYGRKISILIGLTTTMLTSLMWGFSTNLPMAITARAIAGFGNGNVGIIRTTVAEMVPYKELQPRAFSLMPIVWNLGSIFGPMIGGALANPYNVQPREKVDNPNLLQMFPYALPNLVAAALFLIGITTGFLFLVETLETRRNHRDYGLILGKKISDAVRHLMSSSSKGATADDDGVSKKDHGERQPLLKPHSDGESLVEEPKAASPLPAYSEILNTQAVLNLIVYTFLAMHTMGYDQLLPVFMHRRTIEQEEPPRNMVHGFKFVGGLGLGHFKIGVITTAYGICGMLTQFFFYPQIARKFGVLNCLKACAIAFPVAYFLTPFAALLPTDNTRIAAIFAIMLIKCFGSIFAFPSSTILLTNSANSLRTLGTLNGIATSVSAIGRGAGPLVGGAIFSLGVKKGYVIAPWWLFSAIGIVSAIPVWFLVELEGFGGDDGHVSDEEEVEDLLEEQAVEGGAEAAGRAGPVFIPTAESVEDPEDVGHHRLPSVSRTTTMSSEISLGSALSAFDDREDPNEAGASSITPTGPGIRISDRRQSVRTVRKVSAPIGTGPQGISRRYSSNLGQSLGSAGSYHGH